MVLLLPSRLLVPARDCCLLQGARQGWRMWCRKAGGIAQYRIVDVTDAMRCHLQFCRLRLRSRKLCTSGGRGLLFRCNRYPIR